MSCRPAELKQEVNGKKETLKGFNIKLQDTILFPEGGGQVKWLRSVLTGVYLPLHYNFFRKTKKKNACILFSFCSQMTTASLEMYQCWESFGRDLKPYILLAPLWRRAMKYMWRWTGRGGSTTCSNTQVRWIGIRLQTLDYNYVTHLFYLMIVVLLLFLGQHLITALAETMFGYRTTSWYNTQSTVDSLWT